MAGENSYQKQYDGSTGTYQEIPSDANGLLRGGGNKKKWLIGGVALLLIAFGVAYGVNTLRDPQKTIAKELANSSKVHVKANGKLKLFDEFST